MIDSLPARIQDDVDQSQYQHKAWLEKRAHAAEVNAMRDGRTCSGCGHHECSCDAWTGSLSEAGPGPGAAAFARDYLCGFERDPRWLGEDVPKGGLFRRAREQAMLRLNLGDS